MFKEIDTNKLIEADWNYKVDNDFLAEKLENNIRRNGQIENIIVRQMPKGKFEVVNGNHRVAVMKNIGLEKVQAFDLGKISDVQAKRIAIETNETKFTADHMRLGELLQEIQSEVDLSDLVTTMPLTEHELKSLVDQELIDWDSISKTKPPKVTEDEKTNGTKVNVVLEDNEAAQWLELKGEKGCDSDKDLLLVLMGDAKGKKEVT